MYVVVQHKIKDPANFFERGQRCVPNAPRTLRAHQYLPAQDATAAICLWEGPSVDAIASYIDSTLGDASDQSYFAVDAEYSLGLPAAV
ncbi:MAG: hypothetical protein M3O70_24110 [Actinomycetota bacterium]|nr:hypothetical protein [Actinomycetota bacterium]